MKLRGMSFFFFFLMAQKSPVQRYRFSCVREEENTKRNKRKKREWEDNRQKVGEIWRLQAAPDSVWKSNIH